MENEGKIKAMVTGYAGQDGYYLCRSLRSDGWTVLGLGRQDSYCDGKYLPAVDIVDSNAVDDVIAKFKPDQIFHLAAYHLSSGAAKPDFAGTLKRCMAIHLDATINIHNAVAKYVPGCRIFFAASSHIFGKPTDVPQTETTKFAPICAYGLSKVAGIEVSRFYRRQQGIFSSVGILYNHESSRRRPDFLIPDIIRQAQNIRAKRATNITVGKLDATADWGCAPDYISAMRAVLAATEPDEFIVATGRSYTVREVVQCVLYKAGLSDDVPIFEEPEKIANALNRGVLVGDSSKLKEKTGWHPTATLDDIVSSMMGGEKVCGE